MKRQAFTLLELLLAVTLTSLILASVWSLWQAGIQTRNVVARASGRNRDLAVAIDLVAKRLASTVGPGGLLAGPFVSGEGDLTGQDELFFHAAGDPADSSWADLSRYELRLETDQDGRKQLVLAQTLNLLSATETEPTVHVLCRGVDSLELEYFDGAQWLSEWDSTTLGDTLPAAVRVRVRLSPEDPDQDTDAKLQMQRVVLLSVQPAGDEPPEAPQ